MIKTEWSLQRHVLPRYKIFSSGNIPRIVCVPLQKAWHIIGFDVHSIKRQLRYVLHNNQQRFFFLFGKESKHTLAASKLQPRSVTDFLTSPVVPRITLSLNNFLSLSLCPFSALLWRHIVYTARYEQVNQRDNGSGRLTKLTAISFGLVSLSVLLSARSIFRFK